VSAKQNISEVVHYLTAQVCKRVFYNSNYGIMICKDAIKNFNDYDLEPLVVLGVCHSQLPMTMKQYHKQGQELSISAFLSEFWSADIRAPFIGMGNIKGTPDRLVIDKRLKEGLKKEFFDWLISVDVQYEFSNSSDRQFTAKARFVQERPWSYRHGDFKAFKSSDSKMQEKYPLTIDILNSEDFRTHLFLGIHEYPPHRREILLAQYPEGHKRKKFEGSLGGLDFVATVNDLQLPNANDVFANTMVWHKAQPEKETFGFLLINHEDQESESYDDDDFYDSETEIEEDETIDLTLHWRERFDENKTLLNQVMYDPYSGRPLNRWLITLDSVDGWWGEGYVVHTGKPSFVSSWGWISHLEAISMSASINFDKDRCLAVCFSHSLSDDDIYKSEEYHSLMQQALSAVVEYLESVNVE